MKTDTHECRGCKGDEYGSYKSIAYRCPACLKEGACGYNGRAIWQGQRPPNCDHHTPPGKPCHDGPVEMEACR